MLNLKNILDAMNALTAGMANANKQSQEKQAAPAKPAPVPKTAAAPSKQASAAPMRQAPAGSFVPTLDFSRCWRFNYGLLSKEDRVIYEKMEEAMIRGIPEIRFMCHRDPDVKYLMGILIAVIEDNWGLFYVENSLKVASMGRDTKVQFVYNKYFDDREGYKRKMMEVGRKVFEERVKLCKTSFGAELAIHDYLVETVKYDGTDNQGSHCPIGPLLAGKGVCEGIAEAFGFLCSISGLKVAMVSGQLGKEGHRWNVAEIGGSRYHVDVTSDLSGIHSYFNCDDAFMRRTHQFDRLTECRDTKQNYYTVRKSRFKTLAEAKPFVAQKLKLARPEFEMMVESGCTPNDIVALVKSCASSPGSIRVASTNNGCFKIVMEKA